VEYQSTKESDVSTEPQEDLRKEIEDLKTAQAAQTATQAGQMATFTAMNAGTIGVVIAGGAGMIAGMLVGLLVGGLSRGRR
jgi:hypothetical protein